MIDINVGCGGPGSAVVGRDPCARCGCTGRINDDVGAVALEDGFARVAGAGDGYPLNQG